MKKGKPQVAFSNRDNALKNIDMKIEFLLGVCQKIAKPKSIAGLDREREERVLGIMPKSVRQFNLWNSEGLPEFFNDTSVKFSRNANDTLRSDPSRLERVRKALEAVKVISSCGPAEKSAGPSRLRILVQTANAMRAIAESELKKERRLSRSLREQLAASEARFTALEREVMVALSKRDAVISELRARKTTALSTRRIGEDS